MNVPWPALLGWAADTPLLEPFGFQRGFYRVEPSEETGLPGLTDQISRVNISKYERTVHIRYLDDADRAKVWDHSCHDSQRIFPACHTCINQVGKERNVLPKIY